LVLFTESLEVFFSATGFPPNTILGNSLATTPLTKGVQECEDRS